MDLNVDGLASSMPMLYRIGRRASHSPSHASYSDIDPPPSFAVSAMLLLRDEISERRE